jgi:hypothetical protein
VAMDFFPEFRKDNAVPPTRTVFARSFREVLLTRFGEHEQRAQFLGVGGTARCWTRRCGLTVLLDDMDIDDQDSAESDVMREPERLDEDILLREVVD